MSDVPLRLHCLAPDRKRIQDWLDTTTHEHGIHGCDVVVWGLDVNGVIDVTTHVVDRGWVTSKHAEQARQMYLDDLGGR